MIVAQLRGAEFAFDDGMPEPISDNHHHIAFVALVDVAAAAGMPSHGTYLASLGKGWHRIKARIATWHPEA